MQVVPQGVKPGSSGKKGSRRAGAKGPNGSHSEVSTGPRGGCMPFTSSGVIEEPEGPGLTPLEREPWPRR